MINYQGRILVDATNFDGTGQFKFALINAGDGSTLWRNSGTPAPGEPAEAVSLPVTRGLYSVLLGDATLPNMNAIPNTVFNHSDVRLRVWFSDGSATGFKQLDPDQRIAAVGYAMMASSVIDGAIGAEKLAPGAVTASKLDPVLSGEIPRTNAGQTFTGANAFSNPGNQFAGSGAGLSQLNAGALTNGTVPDARLSNTVARRNAENDFVGEQTIIGRLGIGTTTPTEDLEVRGADAAVRIRNSNDSIGAWLGDSANTFQLGLYNPGTSPVGVVGGNSSRAFFGIDGATGRVGSLTNNFGNPAFRVVLDDGTGNMAFGNTTRQMLNLWNTDYGIGVQNNTQYFRSSSHFAWYRGGLHSNTEGQAGAGGTTLMKLSSAGDLDFNNMPGLHFGQANSGPATRNTEATVDEISIRAPAAGFIFITGFARFGGTNGEPIDLASLRLYDVSGNAVLLLKSESTLRSGDMYTLPFTWVIQVATARFVNLKTTINTIDGARVQVNDHNLSAIYIPERYQ